MQQSPMVHEICYANQQSASKASWWVFLMVEAELNQFRALLAMSMTIVEMRKFVWWLFWLSLLSKWLVTV